MALILPETDGWGAHAIAARIRTAVGTAPHATDQGALRITLSAELAELRSTARQAARDRDAFRKVRGSLADRVQLGKVRTSLVRFTERAVPGEFMSQHVAGSRIPALAIVGKGREPDPRCVFVTK